MLNGFQIVIIPIKSESQRKTTYLMLYLYLPPHAQFLKFFLYLHTIIMDINAKEKSTKPLKNILHNLTTWVVA